MKGVKLFFEPPPDHKSQAASTTGRSCACMGSGGN
jgi:hypothetical protein